jgi:hypothetical protein
MTQLLTDETLAMLGVAIATEPGRLEKERAELEDKIRQAQTCVASSERAQAAYASVQQGIRDIEQKRDNARTQLDACIRVAFPEVLHNPAADTIYHSKLLAGARELVQFLLDAVEYSWKVELPKCRLAGLEADLALTEAHAAIATKQAEISAAERMLACQNLLEVEGAISFSRDGKTFELLQASWRACSAAASAREALESEIANQTKRSQVIGSVTNHHVGHLF